MEFFQKVNASSSSNAPIYSWLDSSGLKTWTWSTFDVLTQQISSFLISNGVKKGDRVVLVFLPGQDFIRAFFGCIRVGIIAVPVNPPSLNAHKEALLFNLLTKDCQAKFILGNERYFQALSSTFIETEDVKFLNLEDAFSLQYNQSGDFFQNLLPNDIAFLQYTSGSTGAPKGAIVTFGNLSHMFETSTKVFDSGKVCLNWLPHHHDFGLICNILASAHRGMHHIGISSLDFLRDPISFLVYLSKYRVNYYTQPNFAYHLLSQQVAEAATKVPKIDLSSLQSTVSGAEPIRADTVRQFMENYFQFGFDPKAFISGYGQAEHMIAVLRGDHMIYRDPFAANRFVRLPIIPASCTKKKQQPAIAIVGAGPSGLCIAYELMKLGYKKITIFEKEKHVGGKCSSILNSNFPNAVDVAASFINEGDQALMNIIKERKISLVPSESVKMISKDGQIDDKELVKMQQKALDEFTKIYSESSVGKEVAGWMEINKFDKQNLQTIDFGACWGLSAASFGCGFKEEEVPIGYAAKMAQRTFSTSKWFSIKGGIQSLWESIATELKDAELKIKLDSKISSISRKNNSIQINWTDSKNKSSSKQYDRLIIACPLSSLNNILDFSDSEKQILSKIKSTKVYTTVLLVENKNAEPGFYRLQNSIQDRETLGQIYAIQVYPGSDKKVVVTYQYAGLSKESLNSICIEKTTQLFGKAEIQKEYLWDSCFPHFSPQEVESGIFPHVESMQGQLNTFYCNALLNADTIEHSVQYAKMLSSRFFGMPPFKILVSSGYKIPTIDLRIVDPQTLLEKEEGEEGEVWLNSETKALGYWNKDEINANHFHAQIIRKDGSKFGDYLRSGDLAFLYRDELYVTGRFKDLVIIKGHNYYPQDIEITLDNLKDSRLAYGNIIAFAVDKDDLKGKEVPLPLDSESLVVVAELTIGANNLPQLIDLIRSTIAEDHGIICYDVVLAKPRTVPKTTSGKVQRRKCHQMYLDGELSIEESLISILKKKENSKEKVETAEGVKKFLEDSLISIFGIDSKSKINESFAFFESGMTSLMSVNFASQIQMKYRSINISPVDIYSNSNFQKLHNHLCKKLGIPIQVKEIKELIEDSEIVNDKSPIYITGMGLELPGGISTIQEYWTSLLIGESFLSAAPNGRFSSQTFGGFLSDHQLRVDTSKYKLSRIELSSIDPQQLLLLKCVEKAIEDSKWKLEDLRSSNIGVFVAGAPISALEVGVESRTATGVAATMLANMISHVFDFQGPSEVVDTACSASLIALQHAITSIQLGHCNMAIVAGVNLLYESQAFQVLKASGLVTNDDKCIPLSSQTEAYARSEGCCAILLEKNPKFKKWAKIIGVGASHIGATAKPPAPSVEAQVKTIQKTLLYCGRKPEDVVFVESHATGTPIGDAMEIEALTTALHVSSENPSRRLAIGTVKGMVGHLEVASGLVSLIKAVLELRHKKIAPNCKLETISEYISKKNLNLDIPLANQTLDLKIGDSPILAGVNSFGFGGTNAFALIESVVDDFKLSVLPSKMKVILLFGGLDTFPREKTGLFLYENSPIFRKYWDECSEVTMELLKFSMVEILHSKDWSIVSKESLVNTIFIFCFQYTMARCWMEMEDIEVIGATGVSFGEVTAFQVAGSLSLKIGMKSLLAVMKFLNSLQYSRPASSYTIFGNNKEVSKWVKGREKEVVLAMVVGVSMALVVGYEDVIETMIKELNLTSAKSRIPGTSVLHSPLVADQKDAILNQIEDRNVPPLPLKFPVYSASREGVLITAFSWGLIPDVIINKVGIASAVQNLFTECPVLVETSSNRSSFVLMQRLLNECQLSSLHSRFFVAVVSSSKHSELDALENAKNQLKSFYERKETRHKSSNNQYHILSYMKEFSLNGRLMHVVPKSVKQSSNTKSSYLILQDNSKLSKYLQDSHIDDLTTWDELLNKTPALQESLISKKDILILLCIEMKEFTSNFQDTVFPKLKQKKTIIFVVDTAESLKLSLLVSKAAKFVENSGSDAYIIDIANSKKKKIASNFLEIINPLFSTTLGNNRIFKMNNGVLVHQQLTNLDLVSDINLFQPIDLRKTLVTVINGKNSPSIVKAIDWMNPGCILIVGEADSQINAIEKTAFYKQCSLESKSEVKELSVYTKKLMQELSLEKQIVISLMKSEEEYVTLNISNYDKSILHITKHFSKDRVIFIHNTKESASPIIKMFEHATHVEYKASLAFESQIAAIIMSLVNYKGSYILVGPKISTSIEKNNTNKGVAVNDLEDIIAREIELAVGFKVDRKLDLFAQGLTSIGAQQISSRLISLFPDLKYTTGASLFINNSVTLLADYIRANSSYVVSGNEVAKPSDASPKPTLLQEDPFCKIPFSTENPQKSNRIILSNFTMGLLQLLGVFFILMIQKFSALPGFYLSQEILGYRWSFLWNSEYDVITAIVTQVSLWRFILTIISMLLGYTITMILFSILLKWVLIGKYKPGIHQLWSFYFFRWWLVDKIIRITENLIIRHLQGTGLVNLYYKLLGAKISWTADVIVGNLRCFDLITIGDYSYLEGTIKPNTIIDSHLRLDVINIGKCVSMERNAVITPGCTIKDFSYIEGFCVTTPGTCYDEGMTLHLSPATYKTSEKTSPWKPHQFFEISIQRGIFQLFGLLLLFMGILLGSIAAYYSIRNMSSWWIASSIYGKLVRFLFTLAFLFFHMGLSCVIFTILLKWILIGKLKPHERVLSNWFWCRLWAVERLVSLCELFIAIFEGTIVMFIFVNLMGARISPTNLCLRLLGFTNLSDWDLITIERECFCGLSFVETRLISKQDAKIKFFEFHMKKNAKLSAFDYARPGAKLGEEALVGQMVRINQEVQPKTMIIGNPHQVLNFSFEHSVHPFFHWFRAIVGTFASLSGVVLMLLSAYVVLVILVHLPSWAIIISFDLLLLHIVSWTLVIILQHGFVFPLIQHGKDFSLSSPKLIGWGIINASMSLFSLFILPMWSGSYVYNFLLRFAGSKIGSNVYLGVDWIPDFGEIHIRDNVSVENGITLEGHGFKGGAFYFNYVVLDKGTSVLGPGTIGALGLPKGLHSWPMTSYLPEHSSITPQNAILAGQPGKIIGSHDSSV